MKKTVLLGVMLVASLATVSAHVVRGLASPESATAFVSSPSAALDAPIRVVWGTQDTGLRVACFYAANTSAPRVDAPGWPRVTAVGFELPGVLSGFSLAAPLDGDWELVEGVQAPLPGHGDVTLDFALVARAHPARKAAGQPDLRGIPPGQPAVPGSGMRFCVSGPFPDSLPNLSTPDPVDVVDTTIERLINGVVVRFLGIKGPASATDFGVWANSARAIPLYPE